MAIIFSCAMDQYIKLHLYADSKSQDWIKYTLEYGAVEGARFSVLDQLNDSELFFDAAIDPEIPGFAAQLQDLLDGRIDTAELRPVDEGDFVLSIQTAESPFFSAVLSSDCFEHKVGQMRTHHLMLSKVEIERFAAQLSGEYAALRAL